MDEQPFDAGWLFGLDSPLDFDLTTGIDANWPCESFLDFTPCPTTDLTESSAVAEPNILFFHESLRNDDETTVKKTVVLSSADSNDNCEGDSSLEHDSGTRSRYASGVTSSSGGINAAFTEQNISRAMTSTAISWKRSFKDMVDCFPSSISSGPVRKKRSYESLRRREVALMRKVKPCSRCKARKISCKFPGPCNSCKKAAGSAALARYICIRHSLLDLRFGGFDLLTQSYTEELLEKELGIFHGSKRTIACQLNWDRESPQAFPLFLTVQDYSTPTFETKPLMLTLAFGCEFRGVTFERFQSRRYAIVSESLPTVQDLVNWVRVDLDVSDSSLQQRLMVSLTEFIEQYCEIGPKLPMFEALNNAMVMLKLQRCWRGVFVHTESGCEDTKYVSRAASCQLFCIIKDGIRTAECSILETLEEHLYRSKGPGEGNIVALWAILWALIFVYRDCVMIYQLYSFCPQDFYTGIQIDYPAVTSAAKQMYDTMTSIYAALFRVSTPLYLDWRLPSNHALLGHNEALRDSFNALQTAIFWFYESRDFFGQEDSLLKDLIIEQERRLKPRK